LHEASSPLLWIHTGVLQPASVSLGCAAGTHIVADSEAVYYRDSPPTTRHI
jgi:hypothetical protein